MCCYPDAEVKRDFLERLRKRRRKTFWAWKVLEDDGEATCVAYWYRPGANRPTRLMKRYSCDRPTGLHVYLQQPEVCTGQKVVRVQCHRDDLWCMEASGGWNGNQAVVRKLTILKTDWLAAGLPKEAVKR